MQRARYVNMHGIGRYVHAFGGFFVAEAFEFYEFEGFLAGWGEALEEIVEFLVGLGVDGGEVVGLGSVDEAYVFARGFELAALLFDTRERHVFGNLEEVAL